MNAPVITLLTDFGSADHYVGAMKGVILGICPAARLVDITHEIPPCKILEAAFTLSQAWPCFPAGSIHLIVVDPGVGSSRRPLVAEARGHLFVAPDNGVLTLVQQAAPGLTAREITAERFFRQPVSRTFHGRDIFAPVAAHLASGAAPAQFGGEIDDPVMLASAMPAEIRPGFWQGAILRIDHFGNIVTNFPSAAFAEVAHAPFRFQVGTGQVTLYREHYSAPGNQPFVIPGSSGYLEISVNEGDAATLLGASSADPVQLRLGIPDCGSTSTPPRTRPWY